MTTASDVGRDVADVLNNLSRTLKKATKDGLREAGDTAKRNLQDAGRARTGGDLRLSNFKGPKLGVKARVSDDVVTVSPTGAWGILEPGAKPHAIKARNKSGVLRVNGGFRRGPFKHPGTRDTRAWSKGQDETFRQVERDFPRQVGDQVEEAFGG